MDWMINVVYALFLTTITGSVLFLCWYPIGRVLDRMGYIHVLYYILRVNSIFFCVPFVYLLLNYLDNTQGIFGGVLFLRTKQLLVVFQWILLIWLSGVTVVLAKRIWSAGKVHARYKTGNACGEAELTCFRQVCKQIGVSEGKVALYRSYHVSVPCIMGLWRPRILLPEERYTEQELQVIFLHELTHYKQKDLWLKWLTMVVVCLQWFNPLVYWYSKNVELWSEYACDYYAYPQAENMNTYLKVLGTMALGKVDKTGKVVSMLFENEHVLMRRLKRVKMYQTVKKKSKVNAALICLLLCTMSTTTVFAASVDVAERYVEMYEKTEENVEEEIEEADVLQEYEEAIIETGVVEEVGEVIGNSQRAMQIIQWTVGSNVLKKTPSFSAEAGGTILVSVGIEPTDKQVKVGIIEPDGMKRYVFGTSDVSHTFSLDVSGNYQVFVQNTNSVSVEIVGHYTVR